MKRWMRFSGVLCLVMLVACTRTASNGDGQSDQTIVDAAQTTAAREVAVSAEYPSLVVTTVDGKGYDLASHRGKWVVVNFWATWCAPCLKEMPELSALHDKRQNTEVIGLAFEEIDIAAMRDFLAQRPVSYPIAVVDTYAPPADFATPRGLPATFLINPEGRLVEEFLGPVTQEQIEARITALSDGLNVAEGQLPAESLASSSA